MGREAQPSLRASDTLAETAARDCSPASAVDVTGLPSRVWTMTSEKGIAPSDFNRACESLLVLNHRSIYSSAEALALGDSSPRRARTHHVLSLPELSLSTRLLTPTRRVPASAALLLWLIQVDDEGEGCGEIILCRTTFVAHDRMCGSFAPTCVISLSLSAIGGRLDLGARVRIAPWRPTSLHPYIPTSLYFYTLHAPPSATWTTTSRGTVSIAAASRRTLLDVLRDPFPPHGTLLCLGGANIVA